MFDDYELVNDKVVKIKQVCQWYVDCFEDCLQMGGGLVFCGIIGIGKMYLVCVIVNYVMKEYCCVVLFILVVKMFCVIKVFYGLKFDCIEEQVICSFMDFDLFIVDEIGVQCGIEIELLLVQEIIDECYQQVCLIIFILNFLELCLVEYIGEWVVDWMYEGGGVILVFEWESYWWSGKGCCFFQLGLQLVFNGMWDFYVG